MRRYIPVLLLGVTLSAYGEAVKPETEKSHAQFVPWKASKYRAYHDNPAMIWERAGVFNDFWGIEGQRPTFNRQDYLRYSPADMPGYTQKNQKAINVLGVGKLPVSDAFAFFAKAGPAYYQPLLQQSPDSVSMDSQEFNVWGVSYSTGASFYLSPRVEFSLEYMRTEVDQLDVESSNAQLSWSFK